MSTTVTFNGTEADELLAGDAKNNTIYGFGGDDYSQASNGIIANLDIGIVLAPIYGTLDKPKIMPIGDSITEGNHHVDPTPGTYRIQLWRDFLADGLSVDFVGSQSNGPASLGDKDHEGHGGWTIDRIAGLVNDGYINTYQPDIVLLMIGTNDTFRPLREMYADLSNLIDLITEQSPNTQVLVSSIPPIDPSIKGKKLANKAKDFNALIPGLVNDKVAQGKKVAFVNVGGSLTTEDLVSDGVHPNAEAYNKMGDVWYDAIVERDTLIGIENITGTAFNDILVGNAGANILNGSGGKDTLTGGDSTDIFVYKSTSDGNDIIIDFSFDDRFRFSADNFGGGLVAGNNLSTKASPTGVFISSDNPTPVGTSANFLYNTYTGVLSFDVDGTGPNSALTIATLNGAPSLGVSQFQIY